MITPDPNLPDPTPPPDEPIEHHLARIEASAGLFTDKGPICAAGCEMLPTGSWPSGVRMPRAVGYDHQVDCPLYGSE